jgi:nitrogen fixation NifU-like protein
MPKDRFDKYVENLQKIIYEDEIKAYNERIVKLYHQPKNWGKPPDNEITASKTYEGPCGDTMSFFLKIEHNIIKKVNFLTDGCGASVAAGCQATLLIENKSVDEAEKLEAEDIDNALNGLPDDHKHCAELAATTLRRAIDDYHMSIRLKKSKN